MQSPETEAGGHGTGKADTKQGLARSSQSSVEDVA